MAHPIGSEHRAHHHERNRVSHIAGMHEETRGHRQRARGGKVHDDEDEDRELIKKEVKGEALKHEGKKPKHRADKAMRRAKGGKVHKGKGHSKTNVNVIVAPGGGKPPMAGLGGGMAAPPPPMAAPPQMPPKPPMMPPAQPPAAMGSPAPGLGGMPPRK